MSLTNGTPASSQIIFLESKVQELEAALHDNNLYVKTWNQEHEDMRKLLNDAYVVLAFAFNRIHGLPRSRDTELAMDIEKIRARIETHIKKNRAALKGDSDE